MLVGVSEVVMLGVLFTVTIDKGIPAVLLLLLLLLLLFTSMCVVARGNGAVIVLDVIGRLDSEGGGVVVTKC